MGVLSDLSKGIPSREGVEVLRTVYPALYAEAQGKAMDYLTERKQDLPYAKRLLLSRMFDVPALPALQPVMLQTLQAAYTPAAQARGDAEAQSPGMMQTAISQALN